MKYPIEKYHETAEFLLIQYSLYRLGNLTNCLQTKNIIYE
jgi:hypothetical protein